MHTDVLDQLSDAVLAAEHLGELADHLIGHFVDQARRTGASWTDIGRSMGVTKQAAQKRFVPKDSPDVVILDPAQGFSRFTPRARHAVTAAQDAARAAGNDRIRPVHLVLGLLTEPEGLAAKTRAPSSTAAQARYSVEVDLPEPPFWLTRLSRFGPARSFGTDDMAGTRATSPKAGGEPSHRSGRLPSSLSDSTESCAHHLRNSGQGETLVDVVPAPSFRNVLRGPPRGDAGEPGW